MSKRRTSRRRSTAAALIVAAMTLVAAACAEESPVAEGEGAPAGVAAAATTTTVTVAPTATPTTTAPAAAPPETTTTAAPAHDEEMGHDEMGHDEEDGAEHQEDEPAAFDREIEVVMTEFAFEPDSLSVSAGETVRFVLVNQGAVPHEFRLTTAHAAAEHVASGHEGHGDEAGGHGHDEVLMEVPAGSTDHLTVTFPADAQWDQFACLIPGHYEAGMLGALELS